MRRAFLAGLTAVTLTAPAVAQPQRAAPPIQVEADVAPRGYVPVGPPVGQKALTCQIAVSGTVTMDKDKLEVEQYQGQPVKVTYKVATIKVADTLIGAKADSVKVLIPPADPAQMPVEMPGRPAQYIRPMANQVQLIDGQEGVFFLIPHPLSPTHFMINYGHTPLNPLDTKYKQELEAVKKIGAAVADPMKALKAEKAEDRLAAAAALVYHYRRQIDPSGRAMEQVAIPAEEGQLILKTIAEADWARFDKPQQPGDTPPDYMMMPASLLGQLGLYPGQQGLTQVQPNPGQGYNATYQEKFKEWLKGDTGSKFEVKKFVPKKK